MSSEDLEGDLQDLEAKENELDNLIEQAGANFILFFSQSIENIHYYTVSLICEHCYQLLQII